MCEWGTPYKQGLHSETKRQRWLIEDYGQHDESDCSTWQLLKMRPLTSYTISIQKFLYKPRGKWQVGSTSIKERLGCMRFEIILVGTFLEMAMLLLGDVVFKFIWRYTWTYGFSRPEQSTSFTKTSASFRMQERNWYEINLML